MIFLASKIVCWWLVWQSCSNTTTENVVSVLGLKKGHKMMDVFHVSPISMNTEVEAKKQQWTQQIILKYYSHPLLQIHLPTMDSHFTSTVDTSRPFSSVKEAVAIFGQRLLLGELYSPKPFSPDTPPKTPSPSPSPMKKTHQDNGNLVDVIKKLEAELEKTKAELKLLKERGSETEVALATLNAQLHKNMAKLAQAEAAAAGKAAAATPSKTVRFEISEDGKNRGKTGESQSLGHILSLGEKDHVFGSKKKRKQKPIIPLVGDLFFWRKSSSTTNHHNPLYASPF